MSTFQPLTTLSRGDLAKARFARIPPEDATTKVSTQDAIGCLNANRRLPVGRWEGGGGACRWEGGGGACIGLTGIFVYQSARLRNIIRTHYSQLQGSGNERKNFTNFIHKLIYMYINYIY